MWYSHQRGGAFAEWDYLRGIREGWIPKTERGKASVDRYGTCEDLILKTNDDRSIIHEFPDPSTLPESNWQGVDINDDLVVSHGQSIVTNDAKDASEKLPVSDNTVSGPEMSTDNLTANKIFVPDFHEEASSQLHFARSIIFIMLAATAFFGYKKMRRQPFEYSQITHGANMELRM